jgi:hypothetical protein
MRLHVLGLLSNGDESIIGLTLPRDLAVERRNASQIIELLGGLSWPPEPDPAL